MSTGKGWMWPGRQTGHAGLFPGISCGWTGPAWPEKPWQGKALLQSLETLHLAFKTNQGASTLKGKESSCVCFILLTGQMNHLWLRGLRAGAPSTSPPGEEAPPTLMLYCRPPPTIFLELTHVPGRMKLVFKNRIFSILVEGKKAIRW